MKFSMQMDVYRTRMDRIRVSDRDLKITLSSLLTDAQSQGPWAHDLRGNIPPVNDYQGGKRDRLRPLAQGWPSD